jgi:glycopeptide antibiotics resistance protein
MFKVPRCCRLLLLCFSFFSLAEFDAAIVLAQPAHNVILFIPDGLRLKASTPRSHQRSCASAIRGFDLLIAIRSFRR